MTRASFCIERGLPDHLRAEAAALYWQAFGGKLGRVLGPEEAALRFLTRVIRADQCPRGPVRPRPSMPSGRRLG